MIIILSGVAAKVMVNDSNSNASSYILDDTNNTLLGELLYIYLFMTNISQIDMNNTVAMNRAYYSMSALWFTKNHNISEFEGGAFFGFGLTTKYNNGSTFFDFTLCYDDTVLFRCDDCFLLGLPGLNISDSLMQEFNPTLDVQKGYFLL